MNKSQNERDEFSPNENSFQKKENCEFSQNEIPKSEFQKNENSTCENFSSKNLHEENFSSKNSFQKKSKNCGGFFSKLILRIATIFCVAAILFFAGKFFLLKFTQETIEKKHAMVQRELLECAELVLYKMRYSDILAIKKKRALSSAVSFVRYAGVVRAGIQDISQSKIFISADGKNLSLKIPSAEILGNEILSQEIFDERQGVFAKITTQEIFSEIEAAQNEALEEFINEGFLEEANERAAFVMRHLFEPLGFESVSVEQIEREDAGESSAREIVQ